MSDLRVDWALGGWKSSQYAKKISNFTGIDTDGYYGAQCKDFVNAFFATFAGWIPGGNAIDLSTMNLPANIDRLKTTDLKPGDVFVESRGPFGHTGVVILSRSGGWTSIDQNWFNANDVVGSPPAQVNHDFSKLVCILRIKPGQGGDMTQTYTQEEYAAQKFAADERQRFVVGTINRIGALLGLPAATDIATANRYVDELMAAYSGQKQAADIRLSREQVIGQRIGASNLDKPDDMQKVLDILDGKVNASDSALEGKLSNAKGLAQQIVDIK